MAQEIIFKDDTLKIESVFIDKAMAENLLAKNVENNRPINKKVVSSYARQMLKGLWHSASGESIKLTRATLDEAEGLTDGQHRLKGVIEAVDIDEGSTKPVSDKFTGVEMLVCRNVPREAMLSIDDNYKRTLSNSFAIHGKPLKNQTVINGALVVLMNLREATKKQRHYDAISSCSKVSNSEMIEFYEKLPNFPYVCESYFKTFRSARIAKSLTTGVGLAMYYLFHDHDIDACFSVFKTFDTGIPQDGKGENSPAFRVYNNARDMRENKTYVRPWKHIMHFVWCYEMTLNKKASSKMPKLNTWHWIDGDYPVLKGAHRRLLGVKI